MMKTTRFTSFLMLFALCAMPVFADGDTGVKPANGDTGVRPVNGDTGVRPANGDTGAPSAEAAVRPEMSPEKKEFIELQREIRKARLEAAKADDVQAIQKKVESLTAENDAEEIRKLRAEARKLTEKHLAEQPGMVEKLARLRELGQEFRKDLPAEQRRRGKRLPRKEGDAPREGESTGPKDAE